MENKVRFINESQTASFEGTYNVFSAVYTRVQVRAKVTWSLEHSFARNTVHVGVLLPVMLVKPEVILADLVTNVTVSMLAFIMILQARRKVKMDVAVLAVVVIGALNVMFFEC